MSNETVTYSLESVFKEIKDSIKEVNQKIDTLQKEVNQKIDTLQKDVNQKIDSLETRMDERFNRGINGTGWLSGIYQPGDSDSFGGCCLGRCC